MEQEVFRQLQRENARTMQKLCETYLQQSWFLAYFMTENTAIAAPMVIQAYKTVFQETAAAKEAPKEPFLSLLSLALFRIWKKNPSENADFIDLDPPKVQFKYQIFTDAFLKTDPKKRVFYLLQTFGTLSIATLAKESGHAVSHIKEWTEQISTQILKEAKQESGLNDTELIRLFTDFRCTDRRGTKEIVIPLFLERSLQHELFGKSDLSTTSFKTKKTNARKESQTMKTGTKKKSHAKTKKIIVTVAVVCVIVAAGGFTATQLAARNAVSADITTTYRAEAITYGDVDSTISGSGTLTPITNKTVSCENPCTVKSVAVAVGDTVSEGDTLAVVTETITTSTMNAETMEMEEETSTQETTLKAPCDGIVTELPVAAEDSVEAGGEIAMVMGEDGFSLQLSVDELEIANISIGQSVTVTVEATDGEYTGEVTNVSYNGTVSGSNTYYQITTKIDYEEGIYSGMRASAEIVTESSGDGLLVPVDAVKTSGDDSYVILAPDGAEADATYEEDEIDLDDLTQVTVETGMSDGSYIMIESDELAEGDLILMTEVSTTATGSDGSSSSSGGFGGMDFGNMDFSNFDPGSMPQGGGDMPSNFGGNQ